MTMPVDPLPPNDAVPPTPPPDSGPAEARPRRARPVEEPERGKGLPLWGVVLAVALAAGAVGAFMYLRPADPPLEEPAPRAVVAARPPGGAPAGPAQADGQPREAAPPAPEPKEEAPEPPPAHPLPVRLVYLEEPDYLQERPAEVGDYSPLARELARQALLIAARDGLGLATRDGTLRDVPPDKLPADNRVYLEPSYLANQPAQFTLLRGPAGRRQTVWRKAPPSNLRAAAMGVAGAEDFADVWLPGLVEEAERLSRTSFVNALRRAGFDGKPNAAGTEAVPDAVESLLGEMDLVAQYSAARELHALVREKGESPALLSALVRAYAHLGVLTELHWSSAHRAFKARALLYGRRLAAADPKSPDAAWSFAYAEALAGLHDRALNDLTRAESLNQSGKRPGWVPLVTALCRFDPDALRKEPGEPRLKQLAALFRYLTVETPAADHLVVRTAEEVLRQAPDCGRVHDSLAELGGVSLRHRTTLSNIQAFNQSLPRRLQTVRGLPERVGELLGRGDAEPALLAALVDDARAGDAGEPSWAVLARLAQEARFTQVCARLYFERHMWGIPVEEQIEQYLPLVQGHPYEPYVRSFGLEPSRQFADYQKLLLNMPLRDLDLRQKGLAEAVARLGKEHAARVARLRSALVDATYPDDARIVHARMTGLPEMVRIGRMAVISPHAPATQAGQVFCQWPAAQNNAERYEKEARHPEVLVSLGDAYRGFKRYADAERCLKKAAELSDDYPTLWRLAEVYKLQGKSDQWLATLEQVLKGEDTGLTHAQVRVDIAKHYMAKKEFDRARPYADAAAETWAGWAMLCASQCHEELGDWQEAEQWVQRTSERYPETVGLWFLWCHRTGQGDAAAAGELVSKHLARLGDQLGPNDKVLAAGYHLLTGDPAGAGERFEAAYRHSRSDLLAMQAAAAYDQAGKAAERDILLRAVPADSRYAGLVKLFRSTLERRKDGRVDLKALDAVLAAVPADHAASANYLAACFLDQRGQRDAATRYYERTLERVKTNQIIPAACAAALRERAGGKKD